MTFFYKLCVTTLWIFEIQMTMEKAKNHPWYIRRQFLEAIKQSELLSYVKTGALNCHTGI